MARRSVNTSVSTNLLTNTFGSRAAAGTEHDAFRRRNNVQTNFSGPVYVTEEVYVPCCGCSAPVNAVERVPVGTSWYHPQCLRCHVCSKQSRTIAYFEVNGAPLCANCYTAAGGAAQRDSRIAGGGSSGRPSFLAEHNLLTLSNGVKLDTRTTTVRQAVLMERQAIVTSHNPNIVLALPPISNNNNSNARRKSSVSPQRGGGTPAIGSRSPTLAIMHNY